MSRPVLPTVALTALWLTLGATAPTTAPTTDPIQTPPTTSAVLPDPAIGQCFAQLADPDPGVRDGARERLMGLSGDGLNRLLDVVRAAGPAVSPAQAEPLHDIVCQAYLAGEHYVAVGDRDDPTPVSPEHLPHNVMGIRWPEDMVNSARLGVPVVERWVGFPAHRLLRDGDMVLGVFVNPAVPLRVLPNLPTHLPNDLRTGLQSLGRTSDVLLSVLRDGRAVQVRMALVPQPADASGGGVRTADTFVEARQQQAEAYWHARFAPLLDRDDPDPPAGPALDG